MWAPSVGLATVAPGRRAIGPAPLTGRLARLFVVSSLRPRDTRERQHAGPAGRWPLGNGFPGPGPARWRAGRGSAVLDLLDHAAAELAADQFHAGQVPRPGAGRPSVIRPLLVGEPGALRLRRRWAGGPGFRLPAAGRGAPGGAAALRRRARPAGAALRPGCGWRPGGGIRGRRAGGLVLGRAVAGRLARGGTATGRGARGRRAAGHRPHP